MSKQAPLVMPESSVKIRYLKVGLDGVYCIMSIEEAMEEIKIHASEGACGELLVVENVDMTKEAFNALPEFDGW